MHLLRRHRHFTGVQPSSHRAQCSRTHHTAKTAAPRSHLLQFTKRYVTHDRLLTLPNGAQILYDPSQQAHVANPQLNSANIDWLVRVYASKHPVVPSVLALQEDPSCYPRDSSWVGLVLPVCSLRSQQASRPLAVPQTRRQAETGLLSNSLWNQWVRVAMNITR
jgi:hypothetical protein